MQSFKLKLAALSYSSAFACQKSCCGNNNAGHATAHSPQRIQAFSSTSGAISFWLGTNKQFVPFKIGTSNSARAYPIMGPPTMTFCSADSINLTDCSASATVVPIGNQ